MAKPNLHFASLSTTAKSTLKQLKLSEAATFLRGSSLSKDDVREVADVSNGAPCVLYGHLYTTYGEIAYSSKYVTDAEIDEKVTSNAGDVLMPTSDVTPRGLATATCVMFDNAIVGGDINILRPQPGIDGRYLSLAINSQKQKLYPLIVGSTVRHLHASDLKGLSYFFPCIEEQQKIAEFFTALDEKIRICEAKIDSTERLLAGLMDALFKQKIRLKNSEGSYYPDWRKSTIGKEGSFHYGKSAPKWSLSDEATTPCVRYGDLYTKFRYKIDSVNTFTNIDKKDLVFSKGGEVLVPRVGEDPNDFCKCAYLPFEGIAIGEMVSIYESQHDGMFLSFYFNSQMRKEFAKYVEGGNVSNLYYTYLEDIEITIPSLEEQKAISEFLTDVVNKLDFLKQSKQKYITLKKAFMQRMFV